MCFDEPTNQLKTWVNLESCVAHLSCSLSQRGSHRVAKIMVLRKFWKNHECKENSYWKKRSFVVMQKVVRFNQSSPLCLPIERVLCCENMFYLHFLWMISKFTSGVREMQRRKKRWLKKLNVMWCLNHLIFISLIML